jgi:NADPH:quinone reductase-like Zn-dependent oxidoreductase/SAM-dependent methyltransferase
MEGLELVETSPLSLAANIQNTALEIPDFLVESWRAVRKHTCCRADIAKLRLPNKNSRLLLQRNREIKGGTFEGLQESFFAISKYIFYSFLSALSEAGWTWPCVGESLSPADWKNAFPKTLNEKVLHLFQNELSTQGWLGPKMSETYTVLKPLPSRSEVEKLLEVLRRDSLALSPAPNVELSFVEWYRACIPLILQGQMTPLAYLYPKDNSRAGVVDWYINSPIVGHENALLQALLQESVEGYSGSSEKEQVLRILEVGAGSGITAMRCIDQLNRMSIPFHYTFTDISPQLLSEAKKKLGEGDSIDYQVLNIEEDPLTQGFAPEEFDIILAFQVVHATPILSESLGNLKRLLRINGILILAENFRPVASHNLVFGMTDGWWRYSDFRLTRGLTPLASEREWKSCREPLGFDGFVSHPGAGLGVLAARNANTVCLSQSKLLKKRSWLVLNDSSLLSEFLTSNLKGQGRKVLSINATVEPTSQIFDELLANDQGNLEGLLVQFTQFEAEDLFQRQRRITMCLLNLCKAYYSAAEKFKLRSRLVLVTRGVYCIKEGMTGSPDAATAWGILKAYRDEYPSLSLCLIDLDPVESIFEGDQVLSQLWRQDREEYIAFRGTDAFVLRLNIIKQLEMPLSLPLTGSFRFLNPPSGDISDIDIVAVPRLRPADCDVEIEVRATALNFRDILTVLKPEGFCFGLGPVGADVAGIVAAVGPKVTRFKIGDPVFGFTNSTQGGLGTHAYTQENALVVMPKNMGFVEASTIPSAFTTAYVCLVDVAKVTANDRVLIHAAAGGVGLAALYIIQARGAKVYATAGNERKRAYLRSLGLKNVYNSRDLSYEKAIKRDTARRGVTVVLNSLTSTGFKEATLRVCAHEARFVEIAKINIWSLEVVKDIRPDIHYSIVDLSTSNDGIEGSNHFLKLEEQIHKGTLTGLPSTTFPLTKVREAFRFFQRAKHIGRVVITIPEFRIGENGRLEHKDLLFSDRSTYLITGGLGGIGLKVTNWMLSSGARSIVLVGRSLPTRAVQILISSWNECRGEVVVVHADVGDFKNCQSMLEQIVGIGLLPLRGIMQAAGVLSDQLLINQSTESMEIVLRPKVMGSWYLHLLTLNRSLDFFIMFSSMSSITGSLGRRNHPAANCFQDALAQYRGSKGLPATSINWGKKDFWPQFVFLLG